MADRETRRSKNLDRLDELGFKVAAHLPVIRTSIGGAVRELHEVGSRLLALDALSVHICNTETEASQERLDAYVERCDALRWLEDDEKEILSLTREDAHERYIDWIGWRLDNMWCLAWVLGFDPAPDFSDGTEAGPTYRRLVYEWLPGLDSGVAELLEKASPRALETVLSLEDFFYCAHNAATSARLGGQTVPPELNPSVLGMIAERRRALTWVVSPGVSWSDTDMNT